MAVYSQVCGKLKFQSSQNHMTLLVPRDFCSLFESCQLATYTMSHQKLKPQILKYNYDTLHSMLLKTSDSLSFLAVHIQVNIVFHVHQHGKFIYKTRDGNSLTSLSPSHRGLSHTHRLHMLDKITFKLLFLLHMLIVTGQILSRDFPIAHVNSHWANTFIDKGISYCYMLDKITFKGLSYCTC